MPGVLFALLCFALLCFFRFILLCFVLFFKAEQQEGGNWQAGLGRERKDNEHPLNNKRETMSFD